MTKPLCTLLALFIPAILFAQSEATFKACDDHIFTQVEVMPDFKNGVTAFEDSLTAYLKTKNALPKTGAITFKFIVTKHSELFDFEKTMGSVEYEESVKQALISLADRWIPAKQNSYTVCAYVNLKLDFSKNKPEAKVFMNDTPGLK